MDTSGFNVNTPQNFVIDNAILYKNFVSPTNLGTAVGVLDGEVKIDYTPELIPIPFAGALGDVEGMKRIVGATVELTASIFEITKENLLTSVVGSTATDYPSTQTKTHDLITPSLTINSAEYVDYAIVGTMHGVTGKIIFALLNGLASSPFSMSFAEKGHSSIALTIKGHFAQDALSTVPFKIYRPVANVVELPDLNHSTFSPTAGSHSGAQNVTITYDTNATLKEYSLDGVVWVGYTEPVEVASSCTLYARASAAGYDTRVSSAAYIITA